MVKDDFPAPVLPTIPTLKIVEIVDYKFTPQKKKDIKW